MPRDANGKYTKPLPDVIAGDVISAAWANTTINDMQTALTDSLDREGRGGMNSPLRFDDGNKAAPGISFVGETSSGLYRVNPGSGDIRMSALGTDIMRWQGGAAQITTDDGGSWLNIVLADDGGLVPAGTVDGERLEWLTDAWVVVDPINATLVPYDPAATALTAVTVQGAIDEHVTSGDIHIPDVAVDTVPKVRVDKTWQTGIQTNGANKPKFIEVVAALPGTPNPDTLYFVL